MVEFRAERSAYRRQTSVWIVGDGLLGPRTRCVARPVEFAEIVHHGAEPLPTIAIDDEEAQSLIDELWRCGFRPTEGTGSAGALAATERHLADMRRLVFDRGEVEVSGRFGVGISGQPSGRRKG